MPKQSEPATEKPANKKKQPVKKTKKTIVRQVRKIEEIAVEKAQEGEVGGFVDFLKAQNIAGLAIGLAVGTAATDTVRSFVQGFVDPIVQLLIGSQESLQQAQWKLKLFGRTAEFSWGAFVSSSITLIATAVVIYAALRMSGLYKPKDADKKKDKK